MKNKNLLSLLKGTAQNKFGNKKITSKVSKREKTDKASIKKQQLQRIQQTNRTKGLEKRGYQPKASERKVDDLKAEYKALQGKRNAVIERVRDDLYNNHKRDYDVLDNAGYLTIETTPYEIFDSVDEVKNRMEFYQNIIDKGVEALTEEATKGTSALIHMMDNTILYQLDENLRQYIIDRYLFASVEERMEFLKDAFKYVREYYEEIRQGFETTDGREIAENLVNLLKFRMENNSKEITDDLFYDLTHR